MAKGGVIAPLPQSGRAGAEEAHRVQKAKKAQGGGGGSSDTSGPLHTTARQRKRRDEQRNDIAAPLEAEKPAPDLIAIMDSHRKQPPPGYYDLPSSFDSAVSRSPRFTFSKSEKTSRSMGGVDLYVASKAPGPGSYVSHMDRVGFTGRDRSRREKLPLERVNPHQLSSLPPIASARR